MAVLQDQVVRLQERIDLFLFFLMMIYSRDLFLQSIVSRSKSSVLIPQTIAGKANAHDILSASASSYLEDASDFQNSTWFIDGTDDEVDRHFSSVKEFLVS